MSEFRIEGAALKREARFRVWSWGTILLLLAVTILLFFLGVNGVLRAAPSLRLLFVFTGPVTVIGACILACREALRYAERMMVFALDEDKLIRKRKGFPDVQIRFSEIDTLREEMRWLVVQSTEPRRKIAIPNEIHDYETVRAELSKRHPLAPRVEGLPLKSIGPLMISILGWAGVLLLHDAKVVLASGALALISLGFASYRLLHVVRRGPRRVYLLICLGVVWAIGIVLIYSHLQV